jgi:hypothetical protein
MLQGGEWIALLLPVLAKIFASKPFVDHSWSRGRKRPLL